MIFAFTGTSEEIMNKIFTTFKKYGTLAELIKAINNGEYEL